MSDDETVPEDNRTIILCAFERDGDAVRAWAEGRRDERAPDGYTTIVLPDGQWRRELVAELELKGALVYAIGLAGDMTLYNAILADLPYAHPVRVDAGTDLLGLLRTDPEAMTDLLDRAHADAITRGEYRGPLTLEQLREVRDRAV